MTEEILLRLDRIQKSLADANIDVAFIYTDINRFYFTGIKTSNGLLLVEPGQKPIFYTDFRYMEVAMRELNGPIEVRKFKGQDEQLAEFATMGRNWKRIGYEPELSVSNYLPLQKTFSQVEWVSAQDAITKLRGIKSASEIAELTRSAAANDTVFAELMNVVKPGMSELEIFKTYKQLVANHGWEPSFEMIVCAGVNAVECHHIPDVTILQSESELLIDMGVSAGDYLSDMTRTVYFGKPTTRFNEIFNIVLDANQSVISAIKPGVTCAEMDAIARTIIGDAGYAQYFDHGLGHSVGLEIHEMPNLAAKCYDVIEPGMVITVEPGIYISDDIGVRIEDLICVTETGCEVLSHTEHRIII